jgi:hypothetical protein
MKNTLAWSAAALILAVGVTIGGWFIGNGFLKGRAGDRYVTVKGVSERQVKADLAIWPMRFVATSDALSEAQAKISADARIVIKFLSSAGIGSDEIELQDLSVTDRLAQAYRSGPIQSRFIVGQTLVARSLNVDEVAKASQRIGELIAAGVVLSAEGLPQPGPYYVFTRLNDVKPEMIAEATRSARAGAEQFAADSQSRVAGIRRANQGIFQILSRDNAPGLQQHKQINKTVRVVSTLEYMLAD